MLTMRRTGTLMLVIALASVFLLAALPEGKAQAIEGIGLDNGGDPCTVTNAKGQTLTYLGKGVIDSEMLYYYKVYPGAFSGFPEVSFFVDDSDSFVFRNTGGCAYPEVDILDVKVGAHGLTRADFVRQPDGSVTVEADTTGGGFESYLYTSSLGIKGRNPDGSRKLQVYDSPGRGVLSGASEGEVEIRGVSELIGTTRAYALGGDIVLAQKYTLDDSGYVKERTDRKLEGVLPINDVKARTMRNGKATASSVLDGSAAWITWDMVDAGCEEVEKEKIIKAARAGSYRVYEKKGKKWKCVAHKKGLESNYALMRNLKAGNHTYRVRAFKDEAGKKPLGKASLSMSVVVGANPKRANAASVKLNKKKVYGKSGKVVRLKAKVSRGYGNKKLFSKKVRWVSSDPTVAKVDSKGRVRIVGESKRLTPYWSNAYGKVMYRHARDCEVWAVAHNGVQSEHIKAVAEPGKYKKKKKTKKSAADDALLLTAARVA